MAHHHGTTIADTNINGRSKTIRHCTFTLRSTLLFLVCLVVLWLYFSWQLLVVADFGSAPQRLPIVNNNDYSTTNGLRAQSTAALQDPTGGALVHIGKTGGSTLSKLLRNGCPSVIPKPCHKDISHETAASRSIRSYYHVMDFGTLPQSHHDFYVVTVRDPLDRLLSAFCYEHMRNRRATGDLGSLNRVQIQVLDEAYAKCFPTLQTFADWFAQGDPLDYHYPYKHNVVDSSSCRDLALAVLHGRIRIFHHLYFNYQRIQQLLTAAATSDTAKEDALATPPLLVTRLEHLWDDWKSVNVYLGQDADTVVIPSANEDAHLRDTSHLDLPVRKEDLDAAGRQALCAALQDEYNAYFSLLGRARNLQKTDLANAMMGARQNCPTVKFDLKALLGST